MRGQRYVAECCECRTLPNDDARGASCTVRLNIEKAVDIRLF